ncbi:hypothetical protein CASFOL_009250 [Castilleja foliolosa]|uniref:phosphatidate phosphatase n=1 Tax=Castilleja foliolosa TaxID=1961234 RepID=A0ABD3E0V5_9LAMI
MNVVGKVSSFITQGVYSVATPFHPFGGAVDIIAVKQHDGSYRSTPWYVRFGKFQGVLKGAEKLVRIEVNGVEANFHMHLDNSGEAYFVQEIDLEEGSNKDSEIENNNNNNNDSGNSPKENDSLNEVEVRDERAALGMDRLQRVESDADRIFYEFQDEHSSLEGSVDFSEYGSGRYDNLESVENALESQDSSSEVVLVSIDGHILTAPISSVKNAENLQLDTPQFHLGPGEGPREYNRVEDTWTEDYLNEFDTSTCNGENKNKEVCVESGIDNTGWGLNRHDVFKSCLELHELSGSPVEDDHEKRRAQVNEEISEVMNVEISRDVTDSVDVRVASNDQETMKQDEIDSTAESVRSDLEIDTTTTVTSACSELEPPDSNVCGNIDHVEPHTGAASVEDMKLDLSTGLELSLCGKLLHPGMGSTAAQDTFNANRVSSDEFKQSASSIIKNEDLIIRLKDNKYVQWGKASHIILGMAAFGLDLPVEPQDVIPVENEAKEDDSVKSSTPSTPLTPSRRWRLWPIPFRRVKTLEHSSSCSSNEEVFVDSGTVSEGPRGVETPTGRGAAQSPRKQIVRTNAPTTDQIASLNLKEGQNMVNFVFSTRVLGSQTVEAHIYLWKWNTRIVISDVDGTITKSDVLGQFMPLVGKDWTHTGIAHLFSAIKENGYQLLFLSARAIVQAYLTKNFLFNLKQDGKSLPNGPVVISPDGLFPSLYREVIRRAPHEFKIACLEDIKALFPPDYNPFYAGFGNRDTDELSYRKIGIPKGKIFIINPKGEVAINNRIDVKSYTSLHTLVNDMFPPTSLVEQEDYNSWNYWKMPLPDIE